ncbi:HAD family hydrolase [Pseudoalteromonas rubra]|uniref:Haloacid dehalogenase n=1 Tax=Pseudoalteromonas rubra TaxID=43658 RepID=A0A5S3WUL0_9GAMM|nr:HAD family hydrolase [Pseudoalteromonas rubra]TMP32050.1 hypothetical protein CWB98_21935 [Pseudoalteromonas rubra]
MILISDVDGCLSKGRFSPFDLNALMQVKKIVDERNIDLILASGRSQAYLECLSQLLGLTTPYICENGAAIFCPQTKDYIYKPTSSHNISIINTIEAEFGNNVRFEPNKQFTVSLRLEGLGFTSIEQELSAIQSLLQSNDGLHVTHSNSAIDIMPAGCSKGIALNYLRTAKGWAADTLRGFGDSTNDLDFLKLCLVSGAPSNCNSTISSVVDYKSEFEHIHGFIDFLNHII